MLALCTKLGLSQASAEQPPRISEAWSGHSRQAENLSHSRFCYKRPLAAPAVMGCGTFQALRQWKHAGFFVKTALRRSAILYIA